MQLSSLNIISILTWTFCLMQQHFSLGCIKKKNLEEFCICFTGDDKYVNCLQITSVLVKSRCRGCVGSVELAAFLKLCLGDFSVSLGSWKAFELYWEPEPATEIKSARNPGSSKCLPLSSGLTFEAPRYPLTMTPGCALAKASSGWAADRLHARAGCWLPFLFTEQGARPL